MKYYIFISEEAKLDFTESFYWYEAVRKGLGGDFELCVEASLNEILRVPKSFQIKYQNVRIKFTERFPFGIHYFIEGKCIRVIGIFHTSRDPENWNERK